MDLAPPDGDEAAGGREAARVGALAEHLIGGADGSGQGEAKGRVRRLDETAMEQLDADVGRLAEDYLRRPLITTFRRVAGLRADVFSMLDERHLYLVAGKLCALLAHASADLGHPAEADTHARTALVCAELINDGPLRAYTRWVQSLIAYWRGDYRSAADIAALGRNHATTGTAML
ncbi:hypothetical protein ACFWY5_07965 [Nonomuraea sp. NPDC059007]|uniref:hypothetical protein n=1 Tax=Nonomuraea sp. NPDC059007 TaxID=3346692 RepID=UPI0036CBE92F